MASPRLWFGLRQTPAFATHTATEPLGLLCFGRCDPPAGDLDINMLYCGVGHKIVGRVVVAGANVNRCQVGNLVGAGCKVDAVAYAHDLNPHVPTLAVGPLDPAQNTAPMVLKHHRRHHRDPGHQRRLRARAQDRCAVPLWHRHGVAHKKRLALDQQ